MGDYAKVTFSYTTKNGKTRTRDMQIKKGTNFALKEDGYYTNVYHINNKGEVIPQSKDQNYHKSLKQIETTEAEIRRLERISHNDGQAGLSQQDLTIENTRKQKKEIQSIIDGGVQKKEPSTWQKVRTAIRSFIARF